MKKTVFTAEETEKGTILTVEKVDTVTGEILSHEKFEGKYTLEETEHAFKYLGKDLDDDDDSPKFPKGFKPFSIAYDKFFKKLIDNRKKVFKNALSLIILLYIILNMEYGKNALFCTQKDMAEDLGVFPSHISPALKILYELDFCCKVKASKSKDYRFMVNPEYVRRCDKTKVPQLQQIYNKMSNVQNKANKKGGDFSEKSSPKDKGFNNNNNNNNNNSDSCNNIKESLRRSIKFGGLAKQLRIMEYLIESFKRGKILNKTVDEIAVETNCERKLVLKFLKLLEENNYILRQRGKVQLKASFKEFSRIVEGTL